MLSSTSELDITANIDLISNQNFLIEICRTYDDKKVLTRMVENGLLHSIESTSEI